MIKRPLCLMCIIFMLGIWLMDVWGIPKEKEIPLSFHQSKIVGQVYQYEDKDTFYVIYLKNVNLISNLKSKSNLISKSNLKSKSNQIQQVKVNVIKKEGTSLPHYAIGMTVEAKGILKKIAAPTNPGEFDARSYYRARKIVYTMKAESIVLVDANYSRYEERLARIRNRLKESFHAITTKESEALFLAMVLGDKSQMDSALKLQFQMSGIAHILAISGLHLSLLGMGLYRLLRKIGASIPLAGSISIVVLISYGILTGGSVSTLRALFMFILTVGATLIGRTYDLLSALSLSALFLLADSPAYLYDSSFLLSFGAVLAVGWVLPMLKGKQEKKSRKKKSQKRKLARRFKEYVQEGLRASLAIWIVTLPIVLYYFYEVPIYGFLVNLLVLPTLAIVLVSGILGSGLGVVQVLLGKIAIWPGACVLSMYQEIGKVVQQLPFATVIVGRPASWVILLYYLLLLLCLVLRKRQVKPQWLQGILCIIALLAVLYHPHHKMKITFLDVGQGDASVVESAAGHTYLIDGGSSSESKVGTYRILPFLKSQGYARLDYIFLSHPDKDHISGVEEILEMVAKKETSFRVRYLVLPNWSGEQEELKKLEKLGLAAGCEVVYLKKGDCVKEGELQITCLHPEEGEVGEDTNAGSEVLEIKYRSFQVLFTGDIQGNGEAEILEWVKPCDVLKVAHHGSRHSTSEVFLEKVKPRIGIISCGEENAYGHPHKELLERLQNANCQVFDTPSSGAIQISTDGKEIKLLQNPFH